MKKQYLLFIIIALLVSACQKEETTSTWTISGEIVLTDALTPEITSPLEGVNVYLLSVPFSIDTVTNWFTKTDIIDSTRTDGNGKYSFNALSSGDYMVIPVDTINGYRFAWAESPDSVWISSTNTKSVYSINFSTPEPVAENIPSQYFDFSLNNYDKSSVIPKKSIKIFRTCRISRTCGFMGLSPCDWYWDRLSFWPSESNISPTYFWKIDPDNINDNPDINNYSEDKCMDDFYEPLKSTQMNSDDNDGCARFLMKKDLYYFLHEYKDEYHIKFYIDNKWVYTLHVPGDYDLKDNNEFNVFWDNNGVTIAPVN